MNGEMLWVIDEDGRLVPRGDVEPVLGEIAFGESGLWQFTGGAWYQRPTNATAAANRGVGAAVATLNLLREAMVAQRDPDGEMCVDFVPEPMYASEAMQRQALVRLWGILNVDAMAGTTADSTLHEGPEA